MLFCGGRVRGTKPPALLYTPSQNLYISFMKIRQQLQFFGRVQGVGFRWTAKNIANRLGMTGWALNEDDGSVTVELQGEEELFPKFIKSLDHNLFISIDEIKKTPLPLEQENYFYIKDE